MSINSIPTSLTLWHASRCNIVRPTIEGRVAGDNHDNSGLGIYCSTKPDDYIANFGDYIFQIDLRPDVKVKRITISDLADISRDPAHDRGWFERLGHEWGKLYDIVELEEKDGVVAQAIILRNEAVIRVQRHNPDEFMKIGSRKTSSPGAARI